MLDIKQIRLIVVNSSNVEKCNMKIHTLADGTGQEVDDAG